MLGCGRASTSAIRKRMDRGWGGRSPGSWSGTSSKSTMLVCGRASTFAILRRMGRILVEGRPVCGEELLPAGRLTVNA